MVLSTAVSVASFSVVLAETFAAVGLSSTVPAGVITLARMAKAAGESPQLEAALDKTPAKDVKDIVKAMSGSLEELNILLPKTAKIHAEFEFQAREKYEENMFVGGAVYVATVAAGFSALYETSSKNKITLDVDFVSVNVPLEGKIEPELASPGTTTTDTTTTTGTGTTTDTIQSPVKK